MVEIRVTSRSYGSSKDKLGKMADGQENESRIISLSLRPMPNPAA